MSRIGRQPVALPDGVSVDRVDGNIRVKGPKGTLTERMPPGIQIRIAGGEVTFQRSDDRKESRSLHGLARALVANMVRGVVEPFTKRLEIQGVGYRADLDGNKLKLALGFSHPVIVSIPDGLKVTIDRNVLLKIEGVSRARVGQFAADLRALRPPEPYKGKGVRYADERVRRKVGKAGAASA
ncbi:MAG: 50S ribosomal protein L6 [Myxococcota bacterium]